MNITLCLVSGLHSPEEDPNDRLPELISSINFDNKLFSGHAILFTIFSSKKSLLYILAFDGIQKDVDL